MDSKLLMIPGAAAALLGGWWLWNRHKHPVDEGYKALPNSADLGAGVPRECFEIAPDGHLVVRKKDGVGIVGWLASQVVTPTTDPSVFRIDPTKDGSPVPAGTSAREFALAAAGAGFNVLVRPSLLVADGKDKALKFAVDVEPAKAGWAVLIVGDAKGSKVLPGLPALPGFDKQLVPSTPSPIDPLLKPSTPNPTANMPADLAKKYNDILTKTDADPGALDVLSAELKGAGYADAADMLAKKAADLRAKKTVEAVATGRAFVVSPTHPNAIELARRFTGNPGRVREILAQNPHMSTGSDGSVAPWVPHEVVLIPPSWTAQGGA